MTDGPQNPTEGSHDSTESLEETQARLAVDPPATTAPTAPASAAPAAPVATDAATASSNTGESFKKPRRITPVGWRWTYGDGDAKASTTAGESWASAGLEEFSATETSHIYRAPGTYFIDLSIEYAAEYQYAGGAWMEVQGTLNVPQERLIAQAGTAQTVLVERGCQADRDGPGC